MSAVGGNKWAETTQRADQETALAIEREALRHEVEGMASVRAVDRLEQHSDWPVLSRLPMRLTAGIPLPRFKVRDLLALEPGRLLASTWLSTDDVPVKIGSVQLSWSEFEVVEQRMAVRLTRLA